MRFEHVGLLRANAAADLVDPVKQVIRAVVRQRGPREADKSRMRTGVSDQRRVFVAWPRRYDDVAMLIVGEKLPPVGEVTPDAAPSLRVKLGDVDDLQP